MGYDISIRKHNCENSTLRNDNNDTNENDDYIELSKLDYDELDRLTDVVDNIYMTYNHSGLFQDYNIHPRDFNDKKVKDILPSYLDAFNKLFIDEEVDMDQAREYKYYNISYKYDLEFLYKRDKTVIFIVVKSVIEKLLSCNPDDIWVSD